MEGRDRRLIIALGGALGACLLAIAFLVGRITAAPPIVTIAGPVREVPSIPGPTGEATPESSIVVAASGTHSPETPGAEGATAPSVPEGGTILNVPAPPTPSLSGSDIPAASPQITAYFRQVDGLADMGVGDPQVFAASMLKSVSSGDFSGFDELLSKARAQRQRLQSIAPPQDCAEHHRLALALSADSVSMLERLKAALMMGDSMALMTIATEGQTLEAQANKLKNMGDALKRQAGI